MVAELRLMKLNAMGLMSSFMPDNRGSIVGPYYSKSSLIERAGAVTLMSITGNSWESLFDLHPNGIGSRVKRSNTELGKIDRSR